MAAIRRPNPRSFILSVVAGFLVCSPIAAADANDTGADLFAAARAALANGRVARTDDLGFRLQKTPFSEAPAEGGVLVGFDVALAKSGKDESIVGLRPIYRTAQGENSSQEYGMFRSADSGPGKKFPRKQMIRTVRISANSDFAVGAVTLRTAIGIRGMSLTYMRIKGQALDPQQTYASPWVGSDTGGREASLNCNGAPVVGVFGNQDERQVLALGLFFIGDAAQAVTSASANVKAEKQTTSGRLAASGPSKLDRLKEMVRQDEMKMAKAEPAKAAAAPEREAEAPAAAPVRKDAGDPLPKEPQPIWENWKVILPAALACALVSLFYGVKRFGPAPREAESSSSYHQDVAEALLPPGCVRPNPQRQMNTLGGHKTVNGVIALVVGVAAALVAYEMTKGKISGPGPFREFVSAEGQFRVEMPGSPTRDTAMAVGVPLIMFRVEEKEGAYGVAYADVPIGVLSAEQAKHGLDSARDGMVSNVHGKFLGESSIRLDGKYPGREVRAELPIKDGMVVGRVFIVKKRLYMVVVTGLSHWVHSANAKRFLDSLEVTE